MAGEGIRDWAQNAAAGGLIGLALLLPYRLRVPLMGWLVSRVVAPVTGWRRRVRENLALAWPELPEARRRQLAVEVTDNVGRTLIEIYSGDEFVERTRDAEVTGPGAEALREAHAAGRPVVLVTAHLGNYDAFRGKLDRDGMGMAALFRPMRNEAFHAHYLKAITAIAEPLFPDETSGIAALIQHLRKGGIVAIANDVAITTAPVLRFFGRPAHTPLSAAKFALKYGAPLIPIFGVRNPDGMTFTIHVSAPIPAGTPEAMSQAYNDEVERMVRAHPEQWFWIHKRWKVNPAMVLDDGDESLGRE